MNQSADPRKFNKRDQVFANGLEHYVKVAEHEKGHMLATWKFDRPDGRDLLAVTHCTYCQAELKILPPAIGVNETAFPAPEYIKVDVALAYYCINPISKRPVEVSEAAS